MPISRQGRMKTPTRDGGESSSEESDSGRHTPSPSQHRKFLRSYASSSSLPAANGLDTAEDDGAIHPLASVTRGRSATNHNLNGNPGATSRRLVARPMQRRSSSNETISQRHYASYSTSNPALPMLQSNRRFARDEPHSRPFPHTVSYSNLPRLTAGINGTVPAEPSYAPRIPNGASGISHNVTNSAPLPSYSPPPYDVACVNGSAHTSSQRRSSLVEVSSRSMTSLDRPHHEGGPYVEPDMDELYASRLSRRRKGKGRSIDSLTDEAFSSSPSPTPPPTTIRTRVPRTPHFSLDWRMRENGQMLSGETETEDPRPRPPQRHFHLGIGDRWRRSISNGPLSPLGRAGHDHDPDDDPSLKFTIDLNKLTPFLFQFTRFLSVVPAVFGLIFCICQLFVFDPKEFVDDYWTCVGERCRGPPIPSKVDWLLAALWAVLTGYHCLGLTTGLLMRWKLYYSPLATLVRLLGLQGICWPATHLTLSIFGGVRRPVVTWALIATTTAVSRSIQIWVTSNIIWINDKGGAPALSEEEKEGRQDRTGVFFNRVASMIGGDDSTWADSSTSTGSSHAYRRRERRWNWKKVGLRCLLPTGLLYVIMAWAEVAKREWETQYGQLR